MLNGVAFVFRVHLVLGMTIFLLRSPVFMSGARRLRYFTRRYQIVHYPPLILFARGVRLPGKKTAARRRHSATHRL